MKNSNSENIDKNLENYLDQLKMLEKVSSPDRLYHKISYRIKNENNLKNMNFSPAFSWSLLVSFVLLIMINIVLVTNFTSSNFSKHNQSDDLLKSMNLMTNSSIYNE